MKNLLIISVLLFCQISFAQIELESAIQNDTIYLAKDLEIKPEFPGGQIDFYNLLSKNFKVPENFKGKIIIDFIVEKDGSLTNCIIKNGNPKINKEILRVIAKSPKWKPAKRLDKIVRSRYSFPINIY